MAAPPSGTVTFLFSDIEGSTALLRADRRGTLPRACSGGITERLLRPGVRPQQRSMSSAPKAMQLFVAFSTPVDAVGGGCRSATGARSSHSWVAGWERVRVRMGIHTGEPLRVERRLCGAGRPSGRAALPPAHGGQVLSGRRPRVRGEGASCATWGTSPQGSGGPAAALPGRLGGLPGRVPAAARAGQPTPRTCPAQPAALSAARRARRCRRRAGGDGAPADADRAGRHRQDPSRAPGGGDSCASRRRLFVALRPCGPRLLLPTIAQALGLGEEAGLIVGSSRLAAHLDKQLLLVLDNFEQVVEAAPRHCAARRPARPSCSRPAASLLHLDGEHARYSLPHTRRRIER